MKKTYIALILTAAVLLTGCNQQKAPAQDNQASAPVQKSPAQPAAPAQKASYETVDVDLTKLSSTMVYSEVFNMMADPSTYIGKTVRMNGGYSAFLDQNTGIVYRVCMIADATACCAQGMEFILADENYPEMESDITVAGTFQTYMENGKQYCHLVDAVLE